MADQDFFPRVSIHDHPDRRSGKERRTRTKRFLSVLGEGESHGPQAGLDLADALAPHGALDGYHLLASVRGDLLTKLGRMDEARIEFERAAALTRNERERQMAISRALRLPPTAVGTPGV